MEGKKGGVGKENERRKRSEMIGNIYRIPASVRIYRIFECQVYDVITSHQCEASMCDKQASESTDLNNYCIRFYCKTPYRVRGELTTVNPEPNRCEVSSGTEPSSIATR